MYRLFRSLACPEMGSDLLSSGHDSGHVSPPCQVYSHVAFGGVTIQRVGGMAAQAWARGTGLPASSARCVADVSRRCEPLEQRVCAGGAESRDFRLVQIER